MAKVLYPGSFDPITNGHTNIIEQASDLFEEVVIAVLTNPAKKSGLFTLEERLAMIQKIYQDYQNIKVISGSGAAVDIALLHDCRAIIRGLRSLDDYASEVQLAQINKKISNNEINTVLFFADAQHQFISSSMVKEVFNLEKDINDFVHPVVHAEMLAKRR
jgi:pantetheine-phosphate adenylyltransferase